MTMTMMSERMSDERLAEIKITLSDYHFPALLAETLQALLNGFTAERSKVAELEAGYREAIEDIEDWGAYASGYFQEKHDLSGCIAAHKALLEKEKGDS